MGKGLIEKIRNFFHIPDEAIYSMQLAGYISRNEPHELENGWSYFGKKNLPSKSLYMRKTY